MEMKDSRGNLLDDAYSPDNVYGTDSVSPFMAVKCDNDTSSTQTYYIHINRGTNTSNLSTVVTSVNTSGIQSPNQGNVRHMILPSSNTSVWYTAEFAMKCTNS